jgi:hypothetical protein
VCVPGNGYSNAQSTHFVSNSSINWRHDHPQIHMSYKASLYFEPRLALVHRWVSSVCSWEWMCHPGSHGSYEAELKPPAHQQLTCRQLRPRQLFLGSALACLALPGSACIAWAESVRTDATNGRTDWRTRTLFWTAFRGAKRRWISHATVAERYSSQLSYTDLVRPNRHMWIQFPKHSLVSSDSNELL